MFPQGQFGDMQPLPVRSSVLGIYLAQVFEVSAAAHTVQVFLPGLSSSSHGVGHTARVLERRASQLAGDVSLPRQGDWGLVVFPGGSMDLAVWLGSLYQDLSNLCTEAEDTFLTQYEDGSWFRVKADGTVEFAHPSGTYVRLGAGTALGTRTRRERQGGTSRLVSHAIPADPPVTLHIEHSSGAKITIAPDGEVTVAAASGKTLHLAGTDGEDYIALKAGLEQIRADLSAHILWDTTHTHAGVQGGSGSSAGPTSVPPATTPLVQETHYTGQAKAT